MQLAAHIQSTAMIVKIYQRGNALLSLIATVIIDLYKFALWLPCWKRKLDISNEFAA